MLSLREVSQRTGRHPELLRRWCKAGRLPCQLVARTYVLPESALPLVEAMPQRQRREKTTLQIEVTPRDRTLLQDLRAGHRGRTISSPPGTHATMELIEFRAVGVPDVIEIMLTVARDVGVQVIAGLIAAWLIATLRGRAHNVTIRRRELNLDDEGQVRRIVEEQIEGGGVSDY